MSTIEATTSATQSPDGNLAGIIHTEDLTKVYPGTDFAAVDRLNLDVRAGEIFGLLGPNGAGKTTTAGMLTTRVVPTSGRALLAGVDVAAHPALAKQLSGIVSQQNTLDRQLTVWENLYFHGRLFGMGAKASRKIADELLEQFQLSRWAKASVYALSGGMAQRLMVARAIFHRPSVLFLDEPTAGLDPQSRLALWDLLGELHRRGPDHPAHHPLHGRGRPALRAGRDHGSRQDPRAGHPGRSQAEHRRGHGRHGQGRRRRRRPGRGARTRRGRRHPHPHRGRRSPAARAGQRSAGTARRRGGGARRASTSSTCRSPSPAWRRCSSTSRARNSGRTDGHLNHHAGNRLAPASSGSAAGPPARWPRPAGPRSAR